MAGQQIFESNARDLPTYTRRIYVRTQVLGLEDNGLLIHCRRLLCDFCSLSQCFAFGFLQIPPGNGHPCRSANRSPYRAHSGLPPPSYLTATMGIGTAPTKVLRSTLGAP